MKIRCAECREPVEAGASICPHCHHKFTGAEIDTRRGDRRGRVALILIAAIILAVAGFRYLETDEGMASLVDVAVKADGR